MGQTNRRYPVFEIALSCEDAAPHTAGTKERKQAGDIIALRRFGTEIGAKERHGYLWLRIEGLEENEMARFTDLMTNTGDPDTATRLYDKRRYCIPLARLAQAVPGFSESRARDLTDPYQPFITVDAERPHAYLAAGRPLDVHGLVFDKVTGWYL